MSETGKLIVISGPSGAGKSTVVRQVLARTGADFSVSATTRPRRPGEVDGKDYRFVDRCTFEKMIAEDQLLEWAEVFGDYYGTPAGPVKEALAAGRTILLDIDVQGGLQVHRKCPSATFVLLLAPDEAELKRRLAARATEPAEQLERRFRKAKEEVRAARRSGVYIHTVINDDLDQAVNEVVEIAQGEPRRT